MENHPIPQDVTGFKFRLIGSITVKEFLYLLGAGIFALIFYILPIPFLVKIPLMLLSGGIGLSLAFVPIEGRPMDKMIFNFLKTIPAENEYLYHKKGVDMDFFNFNHPVHVVPVSSAQTSNMTQKAQMFNQLSKSYFKPDKEEQQEISTITALFQEGTVPNQGFTKRVLPVDTASVPLVTQQPISPPQVVPQAAPQTPPAPPQAASPAVPNTGGGSHLDVPNVLTGTVKDPRGRVLPHIIVEVVDRNNIPVRAFRTNQAGIFAAATPLPSGTYTIHLEDALKKQNFSDVGITLNGTVIEPIVITSVDQREQLRRELFGGTT